MISTKGRYAIRVLLDLAEQKSDGPTTLDAIANRQNLSKKYLESIVKLLVTGNIVKGTSGKGGGYHLTRQPEEYTILEILKLTESSMSSVACLEDGGRRGSFHILGMWNIVNYKYNPYICAQIGKQTLQNMLEKNNVDIVCSSYFYEFTERRKKYNQIDIDSYFSSFEGIKILLQDTTIQSHSHCKLYTEKVWKNVRFPENISWMEDQATIFKTFEKANRGIYISNYSGYHYWQEGPSACRSKITNKKILSTLYGYKGPCDFIYSNFSSEEQVLMKKSAFDSFAIAYLSVIPWIDKKQLSQEEKDEYLVKAHKQKIAYIYKKMIYNNSIQEYSILYAIFFLYL